MGVAFTLSTIATSSIEEIAEGAAGGLHFFQACHESFKPISHIIFCF